MKGNIKMFIRQGDILLRPIAGVLKGIEVKHDGSFIVAEGERTGHHHKIIGGKFTIRDAVDRRILVVELATTLTHQEHNTITIEPGVYEIDHEREFDYELKSVRRVVD